jgi:hypothetical protein
MGRQKRDGNYFPHKSKLVQDSEGNEENRYPDPDSKKPKITMPKNPRKPTTNTLKEEILQVINENFMQVIDENLMEMLLDMVNQNVQEALKKFQ